MSCKLNFNTPVWKTLWAEWKYWNPDLTAKQYWAAQRGCRGKKALPDFLAALKLISSLEANGVDSADLNIYQCQVCKMNHVGHDNRNTSALVDKQWYIYPEEVTV